MDANKIMEVQMSLEQINEPNVNIQYVKREKGLMERTNVEKTIILEEDNRQILLG